MKEFNKTNKVTYNLMSFTGFKSLLIFSMLLESPKSYEELQECIKNHEYLHEDISIDSLRVYLTSLSRIGCNIERFRTEDGTYKYYITSHPYQFIISEEQIKSLIKIYKLIIKTLDLSDIFAYEKFIRKLAASIGSEELKNAMEKVSPFKRCDFELVEKLFKYSNEKRKITIMYQSPRSNAKEIEVIADKLAITQGKAYLYGVSIEYKQDTSYLLSRISDIIDVDLEDNNKIELKPVTVGYELATLTPDVKLSPEEKIVKINKDAILVEQKTTNLFMLKRKILEYGPICTVLYPEDFRNDIINTLKHMRETYKNE